MPMLDPATVAKKWAQNLGNSVQQIQASVNAVTTSPTQQAAAAVNVWQARMQDPQTAAKYVKGLQRVTLQQWQSAMNQKGVPRIASGAQQAVGKMTTFLQAFLPYEAQGVAQVKNMPDVTLQDRINRATFMIQYLSQFPGY